MTTIFNPEEQPHEQGWVKPNPKGRLVNLTPHPVVIYRHGNVGGVKGFHPMKTYPKCENPPRVSTVEIPVNEGVPFIDFDTSFCKLVVGEIKGLPEPEENTLFIVSRFVAEASGRKDLVIPHDSVRDDEGNIIGCKRFAFVNA